MEEKNIFFAQKLREFTNLFIDGFDKETAKKLKPELNTIDKNEAIETWIEIIKSNCPVEKISEDTYEIHDIISFKGEGDANEYIHTVKILEKDDTASVFMKFYFVLNCISTQRKSNAYYFG